MLKINFKQGDPWRLQLQARGPASPERDRGRVRSFLSKMRLQVWNKVIMQVWNKVMQAQNKVMQV